MTDYSLRERIPEKDGGAVFCRFKVDGRLICSGFDRGAHSLREREGAFEEALSMVAITDY